MKPPQRRKYDWLGVLMALVMLALAACQPLMESLGEGPTSTPAPTATWPPLPTATNTWPSPTAPFYPTVLPTDAPEPTAEAEPTRRPTALPTLVPTPTPETGFYSDPVTGFSFHYPSGLEVQDMPSGIVLMNADPMMIIFAESRLLDEDENEQDVAGEIFGIIGSGSITQPVTVTTTTLWEGSEARLMHFEEPSENTYARFVSQQRGRRIFYIMAVGAEDTFEYYDHTLTATAASMTVEEPRPYGIARQNALFLTGGQPYTIDPAKTLGGAHGLIGRIFSGLVTLDQNLQVVPDLAERWEISEDGTVYTFFLRPDAVFHDGKPVTARDVKFSWERATDPELESNTAETYLSDIVGIKEKLAGETDEIAGVEVVDDHTLQVTIDSPKVYFLAKLTYPVSFVVDEENVDDEDWEHRPNGTGPFKLHTWDDDRLMIFERFDDFYLDPAKVENIVVTMYSTVSMWAYENDEIDLTGVGTSNVERVTDPSNPLNAELVVYPNLCTSRLILDVTMPPFDDPLVRQAFSYAVDREQLTEVVLEGTDIPAYSILPPGMPGYSEDIDAPHFNPEYAQQLLSESSFGNAASLPEIVMSTSGYGGDLSDYQSALIEMWRSHLGVEVTVEQLDPSSYAYELREQHGQIISMGWCADYPDPENFLDLLYHTDAPENLGSYSNPEVDAILEQARSETDVQTRMALYQQVEQMIVDDVPDILLDHGRSYLLIKPYVKDMVVTPMGLLAITWRQIRLEPETN